MTNSPKIKTLSEISTPAKSILFGEHAVVYPGNHAVLWPIHSMRATVICRASDEQDTYEVTDNGHYKKVLFKELREDYGSIDSVEVYMQACLSIAHQFVLAQKQPKSLTVKLKLTIPIGGFGSSAAVAASVIKAIVIANGLELSDDEWYELVMKAEKLSHGNPSGADAAVVTRQQPIVVEKMNDGSVLIDPIDVDDQLQKIIDQTSIIHTGRSAQNTVETVAHVAAHKNRDELLADIDQVTKGVIKKIHDGGMLLEDWIKAINANGKLLEKLGVVPDRMRQLSDDIRSQGSAIKLSGGGALSGESCGAMVYVGPTRDDYTNYTLSE